MMLGGSEGDLCIIAIVSIATVIVIIIISSSSICVADRDGFHRISMDFLAFL
jgi:hypothetical protein